MDTLINDQNNIPIHVGNQYYLGEVYRFTYDFLFGFQGVDFIYEANIAVKMILMESSHLSKVIL